MMTDDEINEQIGSGNTSAGVPWMEVRPNKLPGMVRDGEIAKYILTRWIETLPDDDWESLGMPVPEGNA
jgi:hypothetical protein